MSSAPVVSCMSSPSLFSCSITCPDLLRSRWGCACLFCPCYGAMFLREPCYPRDSRSGFLPGGSIWAFFPSVFLDSLRRLGLPTPFHRCAVCRIGLRLLLGFLVCGAPSQMGCGFLLRLFGFFWRITAPAYGVRLFWLLIFGAFSDGDLAHACVSIVCDRDASCRPTASSLAGCFCIGLFSSSAAPSVVPGAYEYAC